MSKGPTAQEEPKKINRPRKQAEKADAGKTSAPNQGANARPLTILQQRVGNRAVQRLLAQRSASGPSELDDDTAGRINRQRGGGQPLDSGMQKQMGESTGEDFSQVKVHTDPEADNLSQQLGAKAFTTGQDVFFRSGEYQPQSSGGQELLAHELTHVVQQRQGGSGSGSGKMQVNDPGDAYEQQADAVSHAVTSGQAAGGQVQREAAPEEEEEVQMKAVQRQEEDEEVQMQEEDEEEVQMQEDDDEEQAMKAGH